MTRQSRSFQQGYVSNPIKTRRGVVYRVRYRLPKPDGGWKHVTETLYDLAGRKKEAHEQARKVIADRIREAFQPKDTSIAVKVAGLTVADFVDGYWRPHLKQANVKPSTLRGYESCLRQHILSKLGLVKVSDVCPLHIDTVKAANDNRLSPKTRRNIIAVCQSIFSLAVDKDVIQRSPVRKSHKIETSRTEKPTWSPMEIKSIIEAAPVRYRALFVCIALTGLRLGELLGLQWRSVFLQERRFEVRQSLWNGELVTPKTKGSTRVIHFGPVLAETLTIHFQNAFRKDPGDLLFCKADGSPLNPDVLRRDVLYPILDRLQIPREKRASGFHSFRHSAGSIVNRATGDLKLAQKLLGHSNLGTTADVYVHTSTESEVAAARAIEDAIYGDLFQTGSTNLEQNGNATVN